MRTFFRRLSKIVIGLFCLYHMAAVALYATPGEITNAIRDWLTYNQRSTDVMDRYEDWKWKVFVRYVLFTSQWQIWNLFSPNPIRNVLVMDMERWDKENKRWKPVYRLDPQHFPDWRAARDTKILYGITTDWENYKPLREQLMMDYCKQLALPPRTMVRLVFYSYTLPWENVATSAFWKTYKPERSKYVDLTSRCPSAS